MVDYERLTAIEHGILQLEGPHAPLHVSSVQLFEAGPLLADRGGVDIERIRDAVRARIGDLPRYRQVLLQLPLETQPIWVDAKEVDLEFHVRHMCLPRPGSERQLKRMVGRVLAEPLNRARPLWDLSVIEGAGEGVVALVSRVHGCLLDAGGHAALPGALLTHVPSDKPGPFALWRPHPRPHRAELAVDELRELAQWPSTLWRGLRRLSERPNLAGRVRAIGQALGATLHATTETPLDGPVGRLRRVDWCRIDRPRLDAVTARLGASLEEIVLTVSAGALGRFFAGTRGIDVRRFDLRALVPSDGRGEGEGGAWIVPLPVGEADPVRRLAAIRKVMRSGGLRDQARGTSWLAEFGGHVPEALFGAAARWLSRRHPFNLVIAPQHEEPGERYLLGARRIETFLFEPIRDGMSIGLAAAEEPAGLCWGITADWDAHPDLHELALALEASFAELEAPLAALAAPDVERRA
ncbi:MAG: hypothetical protein CL910_08495 [Deltaproteobacteria bacterium]|jgi:WS/DGAT/MGAT family acyltransferase|nr:hypothetical protein [Deltaproteobacteria bacterium]